MGEDGKSVVMITGGAQGIGKGIAAYLLENGLNVVIAEIIIINSQGGGRI